jgi:hypothetical protein
MPVAIVPVFKGSRRGSRSRAPSPRSIDKQLKGGPQTTEALALGDFNGGEDVKTVYTRSKGAPAPDVLLGGLRRTRATFDAVRARKARASGLARASPRSRR